jgi:hypothetical protein
LTPSPDEISLSKSLLPSHFGPDATTNRQQSATTGTRLPELNNNKMAAATNMIDLDVKFMTIPAVVKPTQRLYA